MSAIQRRDNWSRETVRSQKRKLKNLRRELLIQAEGRQSRVRVASERGRRQGLGEAKVIVRRIEDTLSLMAQQQAWYRDRFKHIALLLRSEDWRVRAGNSLGSYLDGVAR